tara:strand:+ start:1135 stop:1323 length:189 start_codon:yes stop_codon:yes gene_type:complete
VRPGNPCPSIFIKSGNPLKLLNSDFNLRYTLFNRLGVLDARPPLRFTRSLFKRYDGIIYALK